MTKPSSRYQITEEQGYRDTTVTTRSGLRIHTIFLLSLPFERVLEIIEEEEQLAREKGKTLAYTSIVEDEIDAESLVVTSGFVPQIRRLRRITGYLSELSNFNEAKKDELAARKAHVEV